MKDTIQFIVIILVTFTLPMITSLLFDLQWISSHWLRTVIVILFMIFQFFIGALVFYKKAKEFRS